MCQPSLFAVNHLTDYAVNLSERSVSEKGISRRLCSLRGSSAPEPPPSGPDLSQGPDIIQTPDHGLGERRPEQRYEQSHYQLLPKRSGRALADRDVVEMPLLLPSWQVAALADAAQDRGQTAGEMLRRCSRLHHELGGKADLRDPLTRQSLLYSLGPLSGFPVVYRRAGSGFFFCEWPDARQDFLSSSRWKRWSIRWTTGAKMMPVARTRARPL